MAVASVCGIGASGSGGKGIAASAAAACVDAANVANEYRADTRSASSTDSVLAAAEVTLRSATRRYVGYAAIAQSVTAVREDVTAGSREPSPENLDYLNAVCGPPPTQV
jgi:hypothetical protein